MTRFLSFVFLLCLTNLNSVGQPINKTTKIALFDSTQISLKRQIILMQNDSLHITTDYTIFSKHLKTLINTNKNFKNEYDSIYKSVRQSTIDTTKLILENLSINLKDRIDYIVGDLLQLGKCFGYNKIIKRRTKQVTIVDYGGYNYGATGKKYYLDNILLLDNIEIVF